MNEDAAMKVLRLYIARNLVDNPDEVTVTEKQAKNEMVYELHVAPGDMGKVIGRQGKVAGEIRKLHAGGCPARATYQHRHRRLSGTVMSTIR
jgi:predicted RNA-binding protein YlqC (UPF0109 family)